LLLVGRYCCSAGSKSDGFDDVGVGKDHEFELKSFLDNVEEGDEITVAGLPMPVDFDGIAEILEPRLPIPGAALADWIVLIGSIHFTSGSLCG